MEFVRLLFWIGSLSTVGLILSLPQINIKLSKLAAEIARPEKMISYSAFNRSLWKGSSLTKKKARNDKK